MSSADEIEVAPVHEVGGDLGAEQPTGTTGTDCPSSGSDHTRSQNAPEKKKALCSNS